MVSEAKSLVGIAVIRAGVHIAANALEPAIASGQEKREGKGVSVNYEREEAMTMEK